MVRLRATYVYSSSPLADVALGRIYPSVLFGVISKTRELGRSFLAIKFANLMTCGFAVLGSDRKVGPRLLSHFSASFHSSKHLKSFLLLGGKIFVFESVFRSTISVTRCARESQFDEKKAPIVLKIVMFQTEGVRKIKKLTKNIDLKGRESTLQSWQCSLRPGARAWRCHHARRGSSRATSSESPVVTATSSLCKLAEVAGCAHDV